MVAQMELTYPCNCWGMSLRYSKNVGQLIQEKTHKKARRISGLFRFITVILYDEYGISI